MGVLLYLGPSKTHILPLAKHEKNYALALTRLSKPTLDTTLWLGQARGFYPSWTNSHSVSASHRNSKLQGAEGPRTDSQTITW